MRVGNISDMMAGWPAYMNAWKQRPMVIGEHDDHGVPGVEHGEGEESPTLRR